MREMLRSAVVALMAVCVQSQSNWPPVPTPPQSGTSAGAATSPEPVPMVFPLHDAIKAGKLEAVTQIVSDSSGAVNTEVTQDGVTPLMESAQSRGCLKHITNLLIAEGANVRATSAAGSTALHLAACADVAASLLDAGAVVDAVDGGGRTPLMIAAFNGYTDVCRLLLLRQANAKAKDNDGRTALILASFSGHLEVARLLLTGVTPQVSVTGPGEPPLTLTQPIRSAPVPGRTPPPQQASTLASRVDVVDKLGRGALTYAAQEGHLPLVVALLVAGANANSIDNSGWTVLMVASQNGHAEVVHELLTAGADVSATAYLGRTSLTFATEKGHTDTVIELLAAGARVSHKDKDGQTPLMVAAYHGHVATLRALLTSDRSSDTVNARDNEGRTALMFTGERGHAECAVLLIASGADVSIRTGAWYSWWGETALSMARKYRHSEVAKIFMEADGSLPRKPEL